MLEDPLHLIRTVSMTVYYVLLPRFFIFSAYVWGSSAKHNPQRVGKEHVLNDEDVVQIVKK